MYHTFSFRSDAALKAAAGSGRAWPCIAFAVPCIASKCLAFQTVLALPCTQPASTAPPAATATALTETSRSNISCNIGILTAADVLYLVSKVAPDSVVPVEHLHR